MQGIGTKNENKRVLQGNPLLGKVAREISECRNVNIGEATDSDAISFPDDKLHITTMYSIYVFIYRPL